MTQERPIAKRRTRGAGNFAATWAMTQIAR